MTYTALNFLASPRFMEIAIEDAIKAVAKANGQNVELAQKAYSLGVESVMKGVASLVAAAAEHCAAEANAGRL